MRLSKPFRRIIRPFFTDNYTRSHSDDDEYFLSNKYAADRSTLVRAYHIIEKDLIELLDYIEPHDENLKTYSHKTYELLLRASTEFETNCKSILSDNKYKKTDRQENEIEGRNIQDYEKINKASKLSEYVVYCDIWQPNIKNIQPFKDWGVTNKKLGWYQAYNHVKHDRSSKFTEASLENLMNSVAGLFVILFSQFYICVFNPYQRDLNINNNYNEIDKSIYGDNSLFRISYPSWDESEMYDFYWPDIKDSGDPFEVYNF